MIIASRGILHSAKELNTYICFLTSSTQGDFF